MILCKRNSKRKINKPERIIIRINENTGKHTMLKLIFNFDRY